MTEAPRLQLPTARWNDIRITTYVSAAHFDSHYYVLVLPPLFEFIRRDYGVSYTELGFALVAFNILAGLFQTPAGFIVDRIGARIVLIAGLVLGAVAFAIAGMVNSFWVFVAMFALAGLGNSVYHPADYALLSKHISAKRVGQAYSIHTFSGLLGGALAPATLLFFYSFVGWRGAFVAAGALGLIIAAVVAIQPDEPSEFPAKSGEKPAHEANAPASWQLLL